MPETIKHLGLQVLPEGFLWEVILINNASKDDTESFALLEAEKYKALAGKFRIIREPKAGLSFARHTGAINAAFKYLIFCDDDNWLNPSYLINAYYIMENNQKIGALGGRSTAITDDISLPEWFDSLQNGFAVGPQSPYEGDVSKTCTLWGAGLVTSKHAFLSCFPENYPALMTDRMGEILRSGGDNEFCYRLILKGYKLFYDESLKFVHFISKTRWSDEYNERALLARETGKLDNMELNKYNLLNKLVCAGNFGKPIVVGKIIMGYLSNLILGRKSWSRTDVKVILYFYTKLNLGVDDNTKYIYNFYKELF